MYYCTIVLEQYTSGVLLYTIVLITIVLCTSVVLRNPSYGKLEEDVAEVNDYSSCTIITLHVIPVAVWYFNLGNGFGI